MQYAGAAVLPKDRQGRMGARALGGAKLGNAGPKLCNAVRGLSGDGGFKCVVVDAVR